MAAGTASHNTKVTLKAHKPRNFCVGLGSISRHSLGYAIEHGDWQEAHKPFPFTVLSGKHRHPLKQCRASQPAVIQGPSSYLGYMQVDFGRCGASAKHKRAFGEEDTYREAFELGSAYQPKGPLDDTDGGTMNRKKACKPFPFQCANVQDIE